MGRERFSRSGPGGGRHIAGVRCVQDSASRGGLSLDTAETAGSPVMKQSDDQASSAPTDGMHKEPLRNKMLQNQWASLSSGDRRAATWPSSPGVGSIARGKSWAVAGGRESASRTSDPSGAAHPPTHPPRHRRGPLRASRAEKGDVGSKTLCTRTKDRLGFHACRNKHACEKGMWVPHPIFLLPPPRGRGKGRGCLLGRMPICILGRSLSDSEA